MSGNDPSPTPHPDPENGVFNPDVLLVGLGFAVSFIARSLTSRSTVRDFSYRNVNIFLKVRNFNLMVIQIYHRTGACQ
jgi:hypothetical protein